MKSSTFLTAGEAARATGKNASTISRAIKNGKIGGVSRGDNGQYQIDPAALFAIFPPVANFDDTQSRAALQSNATHHHALPPENAGYEEAIKALKETIAAKDELLADYRTRLAKSENLLTDQSKELEKAVEQVKQIEPIKPEKKGLLWRLFG